MKSCLYSVTSFKKKNMENKTLEKNQKEFRVCTATNIVQNYYK